MTDEQKEYLENLPDGTPISNGIFKSGFYFDKNFLKYRVSFKRAMVGYIALYEDIIMVAIGTFISTLLIYYAYNDSCISFYFMAIMILISDHVDRVYYIITLCIKPPTGIDVFKRKIKFGIFLLII